jgi:predicted methyltransferase
LTPRRTITRLELSAALSLLLPPSAACAPAPEARDATSLVGPPGSQSGAPSASDAEARDAEPLASPAGEGPGDVHAGGGVAAEPDSVAPPAEPGPLASGPREEDGAAPGAQMIEFFEIGRGDRVADLGGVAGYSLGPVRRAVGPAGVVYVRRATPPPSEPAAPSDDLGKIVWMNTPDEAPFVAEASRLNAVTLLFGYHQVVAARHDRKKLNAAVYRALLPGGLYIIADRAAPPGSGLGAARELGAIEDGVVRDEVHAAGFELVEAADFVSSVVRENGSASQYVLKFRKPR